MTLCQCEVVASATIEAVIAAGAATVEQVTDRCGAGGGCGRCGVLIEELLRTCAVAPVAA